jgi:hypothetical protein
LHVGTRDVAYVRPPSVQAADDGLVSVIADDS